MTGLIEWIETLLGFASFDLHSSHRQKSVEILAIRSQHVRIIGAGFVQITSVFMQTSKSELHIEVVGKTRSEIFVGGDGFLVIFRDPRQTGFDEVALRQGKILAQ